MSQYPNNNPYGPGSPDSRYPSQPNYPSPPDAGYGNRQPSTGPQPDYGSYAPTIPSSGYGSPYAPPPPPTIPDPQATPYGSDDETVLSQRNSQGYSPYPAPGGSNPQYPAYSMPGGPDFHTPPAIIPPPVPLTKRGGGRTVLISVIALLLIVGGVLSFVLYNNHQTTLHNDATATAQTQAQSTGTAQAFASATVNAQATATYVKTHYPFSSNLVLNDPLKDSSGVAKYGWAVGSQCAFTNGTYQATAPTNFIQLCPARTTNFANFTFEVQMTLKSGPTNAYGGVIFRADADHGALYILFVGVNGYYELDIRANNNGASTRKLGSGQVPGFTTGFLQVHTLGVVANGTDITVYIDQNQVSKVSDPTYSSGQIGVIADYVDGSTVADYSNARVWQL